VAGLVRRRRSVGPADYQGQTGHTTLKVTSANSASGFHTPLEGLARKRELTGV
jgi:hypothetical protein